MDKKQYIKPELTTVTFKAERGYQASGAKTFQLLLPAAFSEVSLPSSQESWNAIDDQTFEFEW